MTDPDRLVDEYLDRLELVAAGLTGDRRAELVAEVRDHIDFALADAAPVDEAAIRNVLDRLGSPAEIVAAETADVSSEQPADEDSVSEPIRRERRPISTEHRALIWLTVGAVVLPFIGPLLGLWTAAGSTRWSMVQKRTAAMIVIVLIAMPAVLVLPALSAGEITWVFTSAGISLPLVPLSGLVAAAYLVTSTSVEFTVSIRR